VSTTNGQDDCRVLGFVGVGLDNKDGHERLTRNEHFFLVGGSPETHEQMQEIAVKFTQALGRRGKRLQDAPVTEVIELLHDASQD
jgi:hypothetical protein